MEPEPIRRALPSEITSGAGKKLRGLIAYNAPTQIFERGKRFTEVIRPGAFRRSLASGRDVISTFNHDVGRLLGRTSSGTLTLTDTPAGLRFEVELPESAADVRELLTRGDLRGSSFFGFPHRDGGDKWTGDVRELTSIELVELGPVVSPAYDTSSAEYRSAKPAPPASGSTLRAALVALMTRS